MTDQIEAFHNAESDTLATILVANKCLDLCKPAEVTGNGATCKVKSVRYYEHPKTGKSSGFMSIQISRDSTLMSLP